MTLEEIYYDPSQPSSFGGIGALKRQSKLPKKRVENWLSEQDVYTLHKPVRRNIKNRRRVFAPSINHVWQADLVDVISLAPHNDGFKYLLTVIDCFSKYAYVVPLKSKSAQYVKSAFASTIDTARPVYLQTDKGAEFLNSMFQKYLRDQNIIHYTTESELKASIVERFNRTLKTRMWRYFTHKRSYRYIDVLSKLVHAYNNSYHRSIKIEPSKVNSKNENRIFKTLYPTHHQHGKYRFNIGDQVRISDTRRAFEKGYQQHWSTEIFVVSGRKATTPHTYELKDLMGEPIKGSFYKEELQKVTKHDDVFKVEKILKTRRQNGKLQYFVGWLGYPPKFDSWTEELTT